MAEHQRIVGVVEMHAAAFAIAEKTAAVALADFCPIADAEFLELVLPNFPKIVFVNVALRKYCPDARTRRNRTVAHHRCNRNASLATIKIVPDFAFVTPQKSFATETYVMPLLAALLDKFH